MTKYHMHFIEKHTYVIFFGSWNLHEKNDDVYFDLMMVSWDNVMSAKLSVEY